MEKRMKKKMVWVREVDSNMRMSRPTSQELGVKIKVREEFKVVQSYSLGYG